MPISPDFWPSPLYDVRRNVGQIVSRLLLNVTLLGFLRSAIQNIGKTIFKVMELFDVIRAGLGVFVALG